MSTGDFDIEDFDIRDFGFENPVDTVIQLISQNINILKNGSQADILVSKEWLSIEMLKNYDGQITVGLAESRDTKIELTGRLRRRIVTFRVNVWSLDRIMREAMVEEVNRIVKDNCYTPGGALSYLDVVSFRDVDRVDVKPVVYRTEFILKGWVFETVSQS